jgi:hypothetical protein
MIDLDLLTGWGLWGLWGTAMLGLGWQLGASRGRRQAHQARQREGYTVANGWFPLVLLYRPGARLHRNGHQHEA